MRQWLVPSTGTLVFAIAQLLVLWVASMIAEQKRQSQLAASPQPALVTGSIARGFQAGSVE